MTNKSKISNIFNGFSCVLKEKTNNFVDINKCNDFILNLATSYSITYYNNLDLIYIPCHISLMKPKTIYNTFNWHSNETINYVYLAANLFSVELFFIQKQRCIRTHLSMNTFDLEFKFLTYAIKRFLSHFYMIETNCNIFYTFQLFELILKSFQW